MAQNYNLNSSFGLNVQKGSQSVSSKQAVLTGDLNKIFENISDEYKKFEGVFDGTVQKEINMYTRQAMIVGMNLKASDKTIRKFDMNI